LKGGEIVKLEYLFSFVALRKYLNLSEAAASLYISESALSKQLRALEEELGGMLFERRHSLTRLTPLGELVSLHVDKILKQYDSMILDVKTFLGTDNKKLRIASLFEMSQYGITDLIVGFEFDRINFYVESRECDHAQMINLLDTRQTDLIIGFRELLPQQPKYSQVPLKEESLVLVVNNTHPFASRDSISLKDAMDEKFCFPREDSSLFAFFYNTCTANGFTPRLTLSDVRLGTIKRYILEGMRITLQTRTRAENFFNEPIFKLIGINDSPTLTLAIVTNKDLLDETGLSFIQYAKKYYSKAGCMPSYF